MSRKKMSKAARLDVEARRRAVSAARKTLRLADEAQRQADDLAARTAQIVSELAEIWLADIRRQLHESAARHAAELRLTEALAVTDEFAWVPWGYELPDAPVVRGLTVRHLHAVPKLEPVRDQFADRLGLAAQMSLVRAA